MAMNWFDFIFHNFEASIAKWSTEDCVCIDWKNKSGSKESAIRYLIDRQAGNVTISGDYGTCVAAWDTELSPKKLADFMADVGYFVGKVKCATNLWDFPSEAILEDLSMLKKNTELTEPEADQICTFLEYWFDNHDQHVNESYPEDVRDALTRLDPFWSQKVRQIGKRVHPRIEIYCKCFRKAMERLKDDPFYEEGLR